MLTEWIVKENKVKYLTIILREVNSDEDQQTDGINVYKQVVMNAMLQIEREVKKQLTGGSPYRK
jgi:hypothetical protein